jgi:hypothetical protein
MPRHELTQEDRDRGRQTRAANFRERRERAEQDLFEALDKATGRLVDLLDSEDPARSSSTPGAWPLAATLPGFAGSSTS